jgi:hypothetical protein
MSATRGKSSGLKRTSTALPQTANSEKKALGKELANYALASGAKRGTNGNFAGARRGACQQQIRDVDTGDQEHKPNSDHHDKQCRTNGVGQLLLLGGSMCAEIFVGVGILFGQRGGDDIQVGLRLGDRDTRLQTRDNSQEMRSALGGHRRRIGGGFQRGSERGPQCRRFALQQILKAGGHHAHDCVGAVIECDHAADNFRIAGEALFPESMTEDHDMMVRFIVFGNKRAAQFRRNSQQIEHAGGNSRRLQMRRLFDARQCDAGIDVRSHLLENVILRTPIREIGVRNRATRGVEFRVSCGHIHELLRIAEW